MRVPLCQNRRDRYSRGTMHYDEIDKAHFLIEFDDDLIQDIVGNHEQKILVIINRNNKN